MKVHVVSQNKIMRFTYTILKITYFIYYLAWPNSLDEVWDNKYYEKKGEYTIN